MSEPLILASTNPQYDKRLFIDLPVLTWKLNCFECQNKNKKTMYVHNMFWACSFCVRTGKSMNNLLSYCGLVDARTRASEKDLPVLKVLGLGFHF